MRKQLIGTLVFLTINVAASAVVTSSIPGITVTESSCGAKGYLLVAEREGTDKKAVYDSCTEKGIQIVNADGSIDGGAYIITNVKATPITVSSSGHNPDYPTTLGQFINDGGISTNNLNWLGIHGDLNKQVVDIVSFDKEVHVGDLVTRSYRTNVEYLTGKFNIYKSDDGENWELAYQNEEERSGEYVHEMDFTTKYMKFESVGIGEGGFWRISQGWNKNGNTYDPWEINEIEYEK